MVVQAVAGFPTVAASYSWVTISIGSSPSLHRSCARSRYANTFTTPAPYHLLKRAHFSRFRSVIVCVVLPSIYQPRIYMRSSRPWTSNSQFWDSYLSSLGPKGIQTLPSPQNFNHPICATSISGALGLQHDLPCYHLVRALSFSGLQGSRDLPTFPESICSDNFHLCLIWRL
jgi:hypothetical protein